MGIDLCIKRIRRVFRPRAPDLGHGKAHTVERVFFRLKIVGELFGIGERPKLSLNDPHFAAQIRRRSDMARRHH